MANDEAKLPKLRELLSEFSVKNYNELHAVVQLLTEVAAHSDVNKMTSSNLAIIWGPITFRGQNLLPGDMLEVLSYQLFLLSELISCILQDSAKSSRIFEILIDYKDQLFSDAVKERVLLRNTTVVPTVTPVGTVAPKTCLQQGC